MDDYRLHLRLERALLKAVLPENLFQDKVRRAGIEIVLSFQCWQALRRDQNLGVVRAKAVVQDLVRRLIKT